MSEASLQTWLFITSSTNWIYRVPAPCWRAVLRMTGLLDTASFSRKRSAGGPCCTPSSSSSAAGAPSGATSTFEEAEVSSLWEAQRLSRRTLFGQFRHTGLERAFQENQAMVFSRRFFIWCILAAILFTLATAGFLQSEILADQLHSVLLLPHETLKWCFVTWTAVFWSLAVLTRCAPRAIIMSVARWKQTVLFFFSTLIYLSMTLPVIILTTESTSTYTLPTPEQRNVNRYEEGSWHAVVATSACVLLSWSELDHRVFSLQSITAFTLWSECSAGSCSVSLAFSAARSPPRTLFPTRSSPCALSVARSYPTPSRTHTTAHRLRSPAALAHLATVRVRSSAQRQAPAAAHRSIQQCDRQRDALRWLGYWLGR